MTQMDGGNELLAQKSNPATTPTVVVVDDDCALRRVLCRVLSSADLVVLEASTGVEAVEHVARSTVDVVLSDVRMPDMNGLQLLEHLRESDECVAVLLISGAPDLETALQAVELGAVGYLRKPIEAQALVQAVLRAAATAQKKRADRAALEILRNKERWDSAIPLSGSWTGTLLGGRYRVLEQLGAGGMGVVYEATRTDLADMVVAIKILRPDLRSNPDILARFRQEAETVARLSHQNIVRVIDYGASDDGPAYMVMERLFGRSLGDLITDEGPLSIGRTVFVAAQTLFALEAAHAQGVVHRDLKPENIFLTTISGVKDIVRVLDFGVAKVIDSDRSLKLTQTGVLMGTPLYLAPEQARGESADARSDLYSVGSIIYEALSGHTPFKASNYHALLSMIQRDTPPPLRRFRPELPAELLDVVDKALRKNPEERFDSARAMIEALKPWLPAIEPKVLMSVPPSPRHLAHQDLARHLKTTRKEGRRR